MLRIHGEGLGLVRLKGTHAAFSCNYTYQPFVFLTPSDFFERNGGKFDESK